jgi:predicted nucleotidyltransferase
MTQVASELGCSERTLRRCFNEGLVRGQRLGGRGEVWIPPEEERYLRQYWPLLSQLRSALRTEPSVGFAVLFGSTAVGEDRPDSDVDLLVDHVTGDLVDVVSLQRRLRDRVGKEVHVVLLEDARQSPALLGDVLAEGRVVVNRGDAWAELLGRREEIGRAAALAARATESAAWRGIEESRARLVG